MKMIYHLKSRKKKNPIKYIVLGIFILLLVFNILKINPFNEIVSNISHPIIKAGSFIASPFSGVSGYFSSKKKMENKIMLLEEELNNNRSQILENLFLRDENKRLKEDFGRIEEQERGILGVILKRPPFSPYDTLIVDLGDDKISVGQSAYVSNVLIGEVVEVNDRTSIVQLFSSSGITKKVIIGNLIEAEAVGNGGGRFIATIPRDTDVKIGDAVTFNESKQYILGVVESVEEDDTRTFLLVRFNIPFSLNTMRFVEIR